MSESSGSGIGDVAQFGASGSGGSWATEVATRNTPIRIAASVTREILSETN